MSTGQLTRGFDSLELFSSHKINHQLTPDRCQTPLPDSMRSHVVETEDELDQGCIGSPYPPLKPLKGVPVPPEQLRRGCLGLLRVTWVRFWVGKKRLLLGISWGAGALALLLLFCATAMDSWLLTVEREPDEVSNATFLITMHSGLWRVCKRSQFMREVGKNTQWNISWHSMRPAAFFPPVGLLLLCVGGGCGLVGCWSRHRSSYLLFLSGGSCIVSGILTLIGIVIYVGSVSLAFDSITGPLRVETRYYYSFGAAFRLCIGAFVLSEFSGVFVIHLFLAELRHRQNLLRQKINSVSRLPTASASVAQMSLSTENSLDKTKNQDATAGGASTPLRFLLAPNRRIKINYHPLVANHVSNPLQVKVVSNNVKTPSPNRAWMPEDRCRGENRTAVGSLGSVLSVGRLRRGNARSSVNIRAEEEIPDFVFTQNSKHSRSSKQLYYSCRECEEIMRQATQKLQRHQSKQTITVSISDQENSSSGTSNDSATPSLTGSCSSYTESERKFSPKRYLTPSPRGRIQHPCVKQREPTLGQRSGLRSMGTGSSKTTPSLGRSSRFIAASESEKPVSEASPRRGVCRCPESFSGAETPSEVTERNPSSSATTPLQQPKKRSKPYQQVTSI